MEDIVQSFWLQLGAIGLFAISGWTMWWFERKERQSLQKRNDELYGDYLTIATDLKDMLMPIIHGMKIQQGK